MSTTRTTTADELWTIPRNGIRYELVRGELRTMSPAGAKRGRIIARITAQLEGFVESHRLGAVFGAETGFRIGTNPDTVRVPDVAFVVQERVPEDDYPDSFWTGPPDLAVEVVSPSDTAREVDEKVADWLAAGTREVWIVRPKDRTLTVRTLTEPPLILSGDQEIQGRALFPGFRLRVGDLFGR